MSYCCATRSRRGSGPTDPRAVPGERLPRPTARATGGRRLPRRWLRAEGAEKAITEGAHRPDRRLRAGAHAVLPAPAGNLVEHRRIVGDHRDRHVMTQPRHRRVVIRTLPGD